MNILKMRLENYRKKLYIIHAIQRFFLNASDFDEYAKSAKDKLINAGVDFSKKLWEMRNQMLRGL